MLIMSVLKESIPIVQIVDYSLGRLFTSSSIQWGIGYWKKLIAFQSFRGSPWNSWNKKRGSNLDPPLKSNTQNIY